MKPGKAADPLRTSEMHMVGHKRPGVDPSAGLTGQFPQAAHESLPVLVVPTIRRRSIPERS